MVLVSPLCGLAIVAIAACGTVSVNGIDPDLALFGFGLLVILLARPLIIAVCAVMALGVVRSHRSGDVAPWLLE